MYMYNVGSSVPVTCVHVCVYNVSCSDCCGQCTMDPLDTKDSRGLIGRLRNTYVDGVLFRVG